MTCSKEQHSRSNLALFKQDMSSNMSYFPGNLDRWGWITLKGIDWMFEWYNTWEETNSIEFWPSKGSWNLWFWHTCSGLTCWRWLDETCCKLYPYMIYVAWVFLVSIMGKRMCFAQISQFRRKPGDTETCPLLFVPSFRSLPGCSWHLKWPFQIIDSCTNVCL